MRVALDTNVAVYSAHLASTADRTKAETSRKLVAGLFRRSAPPVLPAQALFEFVEVYRRKFGASPVVAAARARRWAEAYEIWPSTPSVVQSALGIVERHGLRIFDAVIVATAAEAGCDLLLSEDMHDGFTWRGVEITNPFRAAPDARLAPFLDASP